MTGRPHGPFEYYADLHGRHVTAASIRALVDQPAKDAATIASFADELDHHARVTTSQLEGQIRHVVAKAPAAAAGHARTLATNTTYAVGVVNLLAGYVNIFDSKVAELNQRYQAHVAWLRVQATSAELGHDVPDGLHQYLTGGTGTPNGVSLHTAQVMRSAGLPAPTGTGTSTSHPTLDVQAAAADYHRDLMAEWKRAHTLLTEHTRHVTRDVQPRRHPPHAAGPGRRGRDPTHHRRVLALADPHQR